MDVYQTGFNR